MNGPEHYREAERLLGLLHEADDMPAVQATGFAAMAQVHATLAQAAATAASTQSQMFMPSPAWRDVIA